MVSVDRSLLFGVLALQNGLIDQVQLVAAFQAWTRDKARSLADHLFALGHLDNDARAAIEAMLTLHVKKHGGDTDRSLASLPVGRSTRKRLAALDDPELAGTINQLGSGSTEPDNERTGTYDIGFTTSEGDRFRVLRPHARGGLGAVFVALDQELHREVALKQILDAHADDPTSRQRFVLEAEVTGGLEHPGIVPVYGLGTYTDGRPYYAMRFIRGDSLKEAIDGFHASASADADPGRRSLELRQLLRRFNDVCNAIDYAHSRGVLHRDIKPGNVIVGRHGETLVVDWGLAKAMGQSDPASGERTLLPHSGDASAETLPGSAMGTPAYMSPEQAEGNLARLGPRSDVYSLGATLYCLLTGRPPFEGDVADVIRRVQKGDFPPPRAVEPTIDRALEAVCLEAMALDPADRYPTAKALAEDLERWMADEPVSAWQEPWWVRARRQVVRHRSVLGALAIGVPVALFSLSTIAINERINRSHLEANNQELRTAQTETAAALARAGRREILALNALQSYRRVIEENADLATRPELAPLRRRLLDEPRQFYQELREEAQSAPGRPDIQASRTLTFANVGLALIAAQTGSDAEAMKAYEDALEIIEPIVAGDSAMPSDRSDLALVLNNLGNLQVLAGRLSEAQATHRRALEIRTAIHARDRIAPGARLDLSLSHDNMGWVESKLGQTESALRHYRTARELCESLLTHSPAVEHYRFRVAQTGIHIGRLLTQLGRLAEAREPAEKARALLEPLARDFPSNSTYRAELAYALDELATLDHASQTLPMNAAGLAHLERALALREALVREAPTVAMYRKELADSLSQVGSRYTEARRFSEAEPILRRGVELCEVLLRGEQASYDYRDCLARASMGLGILLEASGRPSEAILYHGRAIELQQQLVHETRDSTGKVSELAGSYNNRGLALGKLDRHEELRADYLRAIELERGCVAKVPEVYQYRAWLRRHYHNLGKTLRAMNRLAEAHAAAWDASRVQPDRAAAIYDYACDLSVLSGLVGQGREGLTDAERAQRDDWAARAVVELQHAIARGFHDVRFIDSDPDFDPVRSRADFRDVITDLVFSRDPFAH